MMHQLRADADCEWWGEVRGNGTRVLQKRAPTIDLDGVQNGSVILQQHEFDRETWEAHAYFVDPTLHP